MNHSRCDRTPAWAALTDHFAAAGRGFDLRAAFAADAGRFEGLPPAKTSELIYWRLTGGPEPGGVKWAMRHPHAIEAATGHAVERLRDLADRFLFGAAPFTARPHPGRAPAGREYDHLSRLAEWSGAEDAEVAGS